MEITAGRSARQLIVVLAVLDLSFFPAAVYGHHPDPSEIGALIDLFLLWRIWNRGRVAWWVFSWLTAALFTLAAIIVTGAFIGGGMASWWMYYNFVINLAELAILLSPPVRRWIE